MTRRLAFSFVRARATPISARSWRTPAPVIRTYGNLGGAERAWVYVARDRRGRIKVGMTGNPDERSRRLCATMVLLREVVPTAACAIETEALIRLGHRRGDGEWGAHLEDDAVRAVEAAIVSVRRRQHVDPDLSAEAARLARVGSCKPQ